MSTRDMKKVAVGAIVVGGLALAGCSSGVASPTSGASRPPHSGGSASIGSGYLATNSAEVTFIQLTQNGHDLNGTEDDAIVSGSAPDAQINTSSVSVVGSLKGTGVTLSFNGSNPQFGRLGSGTLSIEVPQSDGSLANITFHEATVAQYNVALNNLRSGISTDDSRAANIQAQQHQIDQAAATAAQDVNSLAGANFSGDLQQLQNDASGMQADLSTEQSDYSQFQSDLANNNQFGQACTDVGGTLNAELGGTIAGQMGGVVVPHVQQLQSDINGVRQLIQSAPGAVQAYQSAQAKLPSYQPPDSVGDLASATSKAQGVIASAVSQANSAIGQINGYVVEAGQLAAQANQSANCNEPPQTVSAAPTVT